MGEKHKCCESVHTDFITADRKCGRTAKHCRDGKWYCGLHDPVAVKARRDAKNAKWDAEYQAKQRMNDLDRKQQENERRCAAALRGIDDPEAWVEKVCRVLREACDEHEYLSTAAGTAFDRARAKMRRDEIDGLLKQLTPAPHGCGNSQDASGGFDRNGGSR